MLPLLGYRRVSTDDQAREGVSLAAQEERIRAYCVAMGLECGEVLGDEGVSGSVAPDKRPGLAEALRRVRAGEAGGIVVYRLDRLTRSTRDLLDLVDEIKRGGWQLHAVVDRLDTESANGRMMIGLLGLLSQWERETIGERITMALDHKRRQGAVLGAAPYGWRKVAGADGKLTALEPVPQEQQTIALVRNWSETWTQDRVAEELNLLGIPTRSGRPWSRRGVQCILSQPSTDGSIDTAREGQEA